ncbi:MAG: hypothetical protein LOD92_04480, partial [Bacillales bacterium]
PGIITIPIGFLGAWLGSVFSSNKIQSEEEFKTFFIRAHTGKNNFSKAHTGGNSRRERTWKA